MADPLRCRILSTRSVVITCWLGPAVVAPSERDGSALLLSRGTPKPLLLALMMLVFKSTSLGPWGRSRREPGGRDPQGVGESLGKALQRELTISKLGPFVPNNHADLLSQTLEDPCSLPGAQ